MIPSNTPPGTRVILNENGAMVRTKTKSHPGTLTNTEGFFVFLEDVRGMFPLSALTLDGEPAVEFDAPYREMLDVLNIIAERLGYIEALLRSIDESVGPKHG